MSNIDSSFTSNNNYENNHVMISQGGNKKAMKKILSVALSTAMAFSMFASVAFGQSGLTDVNEQYNYLKDKGIFTGYTDGQAHLDRNMTRAEFATVIARTLGLEQVTGVVSFNDKNYSTKHWAAPYVEAVAKEGIMEGQNTTKKIFGLTSNVTVQEMATVLVRALKLEIPADSEINNTASAWAKGYVQAAINAGLVDANADFQSNATRALLVGAAYAMDQQVSVGVKSYNVTEAGKVVEFTMSDDQVVRVTLDQALEANKETAVKFTYNGKEYTHNVTYVVTAPAVESVSAINATQVQVKFTVAVDKDDATTVTNYKINSANPASVKLSDDKKTATLTFANASDVEVTNGVLTVEPMMTVADSNVKTEKFVQVFSYEDEVAPTIVSVEAKTNSTTAKTLTVKASEPIKAALAKVNGSYVTVNFNNTDTAEITGLSLETGKTHTLELINLKDQADNTTVSASVTFEVSVDTTVPTATLTTQSDKEILVTFSKKMDSASVLAALANGSVKDEALNAVQTGTPEAVEDTDNTQFIIPITASNIYANKDSRTFYVVLPETITDALGNKVAATTQAVTLNKDTVKPVATGYKVIKDSNDKVTAIEVSFSEGLATGSPAAPSVVNENGVAVTNFLGGLTAQSITAGDTKVVYKATTPAKLSGTYAFSFAKGLVTDQAETGNKSDAFNYTINFGTGETSFELISASATSTNVIEVNFGKAVKGGAVANSATDLANYTLAGKPLPTGTTITLNSAQDTATITLPSEESVETTDANAIFTVANVQAISGETVKAYTGTVSVKDNVKPVLQSAKILDNKTIELTYSEAISLTSALAEVGDEFVIKEGSTALTLAAGELKADYVSGFDNKIKITIVKTTGGSASVEGKAVASGTNSSIVGFSNETQANKTESVDFKVVDESGTLKVQKVSDSSEVTSLTAGNGSFEFNGVTVTITDATDGNTFTVATTKAEAEVSGTATTLDLTKTITVETKTPGTADVKDKAGNAQKEEVKVEVSK